MQEPFRRIEKDGLPVVYEPAGWKPLFAGLDIGISSRIGGVSTGLFQSLNCGLHVDDHPQQVVKNRRILASATTLPFEAWTFAEQVHGNGVEVVTEKHRGLGRDSRITALQETDAMVTDKEGICLSLQFADCVPIYFIDPVRRVIALAHAGWKGTVKKIAMHTIDKMSEVFGCRKDTMMSIIGPSIRSCCYEVDTRVIREVNAVMEELQIEDSAYSQINEHHYKLDLQQLNRQIMIKAGMLPTHIEISNICTSCNTDSFFSHRAEKGMTGRMVAWIAMVSNHDNKFG